MSNKLSDRRIRLGMVGGGQGAFIGNVHRIAARIDDEYVLVIDVELGALPQVNNIFECESVQAEDFSKT